MSFETLHNTIRSRFETEVENSQSVVTVYDNAPDNHPDNGSWIRFAVRPALSRQVDSGPTYRTTGVAIAQIFQPIEQGDQAALQLADVVTTAFRRLTDTGVKFFVPSLNVVGRDGKWWQINVSCPFQCDLIP